MRFSWIPVVGVSSFLAACAPAPATPPPAFPALPAPTCAPSPPSPPPGPAAVTPPAPATTAPVATAPAPEPPPPPSAFVAAIDAAATAIGAGDGAAADKQLAAAGAAAGDDAHLGFLIAHTRAVRFASAGDFERAAASLVAVVPGLAKHPELSDEFWSHNALMMLREALGDPAAALAEDDQATICATRGTWEPQGREKLAFDKDRWHRAYLTRMLAESRSGSARQALIVYAEAALEEYRAHGFPDSTAVLDAYFAALDGKRDAALAAAKQVDPAKDDDLEDLYLVVVGLEAGGDHAAAEAVRRAMRKPGRPHIARAIMLRWLDLDVKAAKGAKEHVFTPLHAAAR